MQPHNGILQHNTATLNEKSLASSVSPSPGSAAVRTYAPVTNSSEEEGTASELDSENLEGSTLGLLQPKKEPHAFTAPDLSRTSERAHNPDAVSVSDIDP